MNSLVLNRRLITISGIGSGISLALCGLGIWLFRFGWFVSFASNNIVSLLVTFIAIAAFFGPPVLLILLAWRWEPKPKHVQSIILRWLLATVGAIIGWLLTVFVITGFNMEFISFYGQSLSQPEMYVTVAGGAAVVGFLDWFFLTRHWKGKSPVTQSNDDTMNSGHREK